LPANVRGAGEAVLATYFTGTSGKSVLFKTEQGTYFDIDNETGSEGYGFPSIDVADIRKVANPYGGDSQEARENSVYYSFG